MPDSTITKTARKTAQRAKPSTEAMSDPKTLAAAGAALLALPYAAKGLSRLAGGARDKAAAGGGKIASLKDKATEGATAKAKEIAGEVADEKLKPKLPGGLGGLFGGGDDEEGQDGAEATGSGRRMPIQQSIDVAAPLQATYNLWTQFEEWPSYMHRVDSVDQVDDATVAMSTKVWGITKRFEAEIVEQRPDERIEWDVSDGLSHTGVVTFHELAPRLTRVEVTLDVQPDSLLEKAGRGMRFTKRAVRGDLHRFKAHAEITEEADEGWRGTIEDGEVKRKTERKSSGRSRSNGRSTGRSRNGSDPTEDARKSGSRN